ncbi:hypothetical protein FRC10_010449 [Ceratobasidium sp. 414]|nr:hypothetical protein FRC10_010449 [Ceratobasidium sp. 414]
MIRNGYGPLGGKLADLWWLQYISIVVYQEYESTFQALARLPYLKSLLLSWSDVSVPSESSIIVPDSSFPCLQRLALHGCPGSVVYRICKIASLFPRLLKAEIIFGGGVRRRHDDDNDRSIAVVECLGQNSPLLHGLAVYTRANYGTFVVSPRVINGLTGIHLKSLRLSKIVFDPTGEGPTMDDRGYGRGNVAGLWVSFLTAVPHLEELHLREQEVWPEHLGWFARHLPHLRLLVLEYFDFDKVKDPTGQLVVISKPNSSEPGS